MVISEPSLEISKVYATSHRFVTSSNCKRSHILAWVACYQKHIWRSKTVRLW